MRGWRPRTDWSPTARAVAGGAVALGLVGAATAAMLPLRGHMAVATAGLVLVVPVVAGVAVGGFAGGVVATAAGFLAYDLVFIPPYGTLAVGAAQDWAALGVYVVVMTVVARVVARADRIRAEAQRRADDVRRLFDLSELVARGSSVDELGAAIVEAVRQAFDLESAALLLPHQGRLALAASAGRPLTETDLERLAPAAGVPVSLGTGGPPGALHTMALVSSGRALGLLALRGLPTGTPAELVGAFANHMALALERAQLHEQVVEAQALDTVDRLRRSLVGAVSHDLRAPLAAVKVATSALLDTDAALAEPDARELVSLIDTQADRLSALVANLLDMTRIQSGSLELRRQPLEVEPLVRGALAALGHLADGGRVRVELAPGLPAVEADPVLARSVLVNLLDNALRYAPEGTPVVVSARRAGPARLEVAVADTGPGVDLDRSTSIFEMVSRAEAGGRGGLGLAIAKAFVEAHGERIWVERPDEGGARFVFTLPAAAT